MSLDCTAHGQPLPDMQWTHNGHMLSPDSVHERFDLNSSFVTSSLTIESTNLMLSGKYACHATNNRGAANKVFKVRFQGGSDAWCAMFLKLYFIVVFIFNLIWSFAACILYSSSNNWGWGADCVWKYYINPRTSIQHSLSNNWRAYPISNMVPKWEWSHSWCSYGDWWAKWRNSSFCTLFQASLW